MSTVRDLSAADAYEHGRWVVSQLDGRRVVLWPHSTGFGPILWAAQYRPADKPPPYVIDGTYNRHYLVCFGPTIAEALGNLRRFEPSLTWPL